MDNRKVLPGLTKIFFGLIYKDSEKYREMRKKIEDFAAIDLESEEILFDFTDYYKEEFGSSLKRKWVTVKRIIQEDELVELKQKAIDWEKQLSTSGKRSVNCDPGGISESRVILVTTKNYSHRIYLGRGIFGEVTLIYKDKRFQPLIWAYPDYRSIAFIKFAKDCREKFRLDKRALSLDKSGMKANFH
ncbi:MAG: DUF4416 family protein [candidate division WOR-3 bacterium]|nr:DUF4416 family protein [candidate division WOR-3 bacterium]